jgi:hypothetical protein
MNLIAIRNEVRQLREQMPPPKGQAPVIVLAAKGPRPANEPTDDGFLRWFYRDEKELEELCAKFDRLYGPETRGPNDPPCLFVRFTDTTEFSEEQQLKGTHLEHGEVAS